MPEFSSSLAWRGTSLQLDEDEKSIQMVKNTQIIQSEHILLPCLARDRSWRIVNEPPR